MLDVMLESFAAPARKLDVTCRKSFLLAARNYSYIVYIYMYCIPQAKRCHYVGV